MSHRRTVWAGYILVLMISAWPSLAAAQDDNPFAPGGTLAEPQNKKDEKLKVTVAVEPATAAPGATVTLKVTLTPAAGWYTYPTRQDNPDFAGSVTSLAIEGGKVAEAMGAIKEPAPKLKTEEGLGQFAIFDSKFTLEQSLKIAANAPAGAHKIKVIVRSQVCSNVCLPFNESYEATFTVAATGAAPAAATPVAPLGKKERLRMEASLEPNRVKRGEAVNFRLILEPAKGFYTYPAAQADPKAASYITVISFDESALVPEGPFREPEGVVKPVPEEGITAKKTYKDVATIERTLRVRSDLPPGPRKVAVKVRTQACDDKNCVPYAKTFEFDLDIDDAAPVASVSGPASLAAPPMPAKPPESAPGIGLNADRLAAAYAQIAENIIGVDGQAQDAGASDLLTFLLAGVFWGGISLLTPCVFPMIPITVSFFLKQSEREHQRPVLLAVVYSLTIVGVLTLAAVFLLSVLQALSQSSWMNFFLGGLFIVFALSLFGMYEIELPSFLSRYTTKGEQRGGMAGTVFMALTFTIISFSCVAPFLGSFAGTAVQQRPLHEIVLGGLAFSATFAAPFFLLALFPGMLKSLPRSGSWMNRIKVVMGFLELAAAFKFLRAGELTLMGGEPAVLFSYDFVLGTWVAIALLCAAYLLNVFRLPHDTPSESLTVPRLLVACTFVTLAFYLLPGMFKVNAEGKPQRPDGMVFAWVDAFLLPEPKEGGGTLAWSSDLEATLKQARDQLVRSGQRQLVVIDFTGHICTNCRYNEHNVFPKPKVEKLLRQFHRVQLYTDAGTPIEDANQKFEMRAFKTLELPLYVIVEPLANGKIRHLGQLGGKTNPEEFSAFLEKALRPGDAAVMAKQ